MPEKSRATGIEERPYPGTPRWVKIFGTILGVLAVLVAILLSAGGGRHGPMRHFSAADEGADTSTSRGQE